MSLANQVFWQLVVGDENDSESSPVEADKQAVVKSVTDPSTVL
jgi:hypothetical protein